VSHPLIAKLEQHGPLSDEEKQVIQQITSRVTTYKAHEEIVPEGSTPSHSSLVLEGFAARHQHLADGKRQITAFHVPGVRIPMKPDAYSKVKPDIYSVFIPDSVPI
jgi:CRP-like cAMP-binding protein